MAANIKTGYHELIIISIEKPIASNKLTYNIQTEKDPD